MTSLAVGGLVMLYWNGTSNLSFQKMLKNCRFSTLVIFLLIYGANKLLNVFT